jgi:hypothetical protein
MSAVYGSLFSIQAVGNFWSLLHVQGHQREAGKNILPSANCSMVPCVAKIDCSAKKGGITLLWVGKC